MKWVKTFLPLLIVVALYAAFPTDSTVDDNFNRADANPISGGIGWTAPLRTGNGNLEIISNVVGSAAGGGSNTAYTNNTYGADVEAFVTVSTKTGNGNCIAIVLRVADPGGSVMDGYWAEFCADAGTDTWDLYRFDNGTATHIGTGGTQELTAGDFMGADMIGTTFTIYYKAAAGGWTSKSSTTDSTYSAAGRVGLGIENAAGRIDDLVVSTVTAGGAASRRRIISF